MTDESVPVLEFLNEKILPVWQDLDAKLKPHMTNPTTISGEDAPDTALTIGAAVGHIHETLRIMMHAMLEHGLHDKGVAAYMHGCVEERDRTIDSIRHWESNLDFEKLHWRGERPLELANFMFDEMQQFITAHPTIFKTVAYDTTGAVRKTPGGEQNGGRQ